MNKLNGLYFGTVEEVLSPDKAANSNKYQTEYRVVLTIDLYAQVPVVCVQMNQSGNSDEYEDVVLRRGARVLVMFPRGDRTFGIIVGALRGYKSPMDAALGAYRTIRFNQIVQTINKDREYLVQSDSGPNLKVSPTQVLLDDSEGQKITLDKTTKTLTIDANEWKVKILGNADVQVNGDVTVQSKTAKVNVQQNCDIIAKTASITTTGETKIKASGEVTVDGQNVTLNGDAGKVLTTKTQQFCYVSGIKFIGVDNVKAGK